jgi:hypothetical protein
MFFSKSYTAQSLKALDPSELKDLLDHFNIRNRRPSTDQSWQQLQQRISLAQSRARRVALPANRRSIEDMLGY